jgi:hypothetical protein
MCYTEACMLVRSAREADQNFSRLIAEVRPVAADRMSDPAWRSAYERMQALLAAKPRAGYRLGRIMPEDKHGESRW